MGIIVIGIPIDDKIPQSRQVDQQQHGQGQDDQTETPALIG